MRFTCFTPSSCFDLEFTACNGLQDAIPMGVCTSGFMKGHMLVRRTSCTLMWCTVPFSSCIHMFASNIFGVLQGEAVQIFTSKNMVADKDTIATLLDTSNSRLSMKMSRFIEPSPKCNGTSLKTVVLPQRYIFERSKCFQSSRSMVAKTQRRNCTNLWVAQACVVRTFVVQATCVLSNRHAR